MTDQDEKRRHDRYSADDVQGEFSYSVDARVLNISMGGLAVRTQTQLAIGRGYRFRLGREGDAVQLSGSVRWCRLAGTERREDGDIVPVYEAGISFDDVLSGKAEQLLLFMEQNIIVDLKRRISGRFQVERDNPVELESHSGFEVRQISLSGMMIESDVAVPPDTRLDLEMGLGQARFTTTARSIYLSEIELDESDEEPETPRYRMGLEFTHTTAAMRSVLETFIRTELGREDDEDGTTR